MHKNGAKATGSTSPSSFQVLPPTQNTDNNTMLSPENFGVLLFNSTISRD